MKKNYLYIALIVAAMALFIVSCSDKPAGPQPEPPKTPVIESVLPNSIYATDIFTITGKYFGATQAEKKGKVFIGTSVAKIEKWTDTLIEASRTDIDTGKYDVYIKTYDSVISNKIKITIVPETQQLPLQISKVTPDKCEYKTEITIEGTELGDNKDTNYVKIGSQKVAENAYISWDKYQIKCKVPDLEVSGKYKVVVVKAGKESNAIEIEFTAKASTPTPTISKLQPDSAFVGDTVKILGNNFGATQSTSFVTLGSKHISPFAWSNVEIKFIVPSDAKKDSIKVTVNEKTSNAIFLFVKDQSTETKAPEILLTDKSEYAPGGLVKITGKHFTATKGKVIFFPNVEATTINQWNDSIIRVNVPFGAKSGEMYVVNTDGKTSNKVKYAIKIDDMYKMVLIPSGTFKMGDDTESESSPAHNVTITYDFYMAESEVTQKQYSTITSIDPFPDKGDNYAANHVAFTDAIKFCNALSKKMGIDTCYVLSGGKYTCNFEANGYRLPTEAEWEYACRGGITDNEYGIKGNPKNFAWYSDNSGGVTYPKNVKQLQPNAYGLYDMNGNVAEWVWDYYSLSYYNECSGGITDPTGPVSGGGSRVIRGGHFQSDILKIKASTRESANENAGGKDYKVGFRFVRKK